MISDDEFASLVEYQMTDDELEAVMSPWSDLDIDAVIAGSPPPDIDAEGS